MLETEPKTSYMVTSSKIDSQLVLVFLKTKRRITQKKTVTQRREYLTSQSGACRFIFGFLSNHFALQYKSHFLSEKNGSKLVSVLLYFVVLFLFLQTQTSIQHLIGKSL